MGNKNEVLQQDSLAQFLTETGHGSTWTASSWQKSCRNSSFCSDLTSIINAIYNHSHLESQGKSGSRKHYCFVSITSSYLARTLCGIYPVFCPVFIRFLFAPYQPEPPCGNNFNDAPNSPLTRSLPPRRQHLTSSRTPAGIVARGAQYGRLLVCIRCQPVAQCLRWWIWQRQYGGRRWQWWHRWRKFDAIGAECTGTTGREDFS